MTHQGPTNGSGAKGWGAYTTPEWVLTAVLAFATLAVLYQLTKISDLSNDIRSTTGRIDQASARIDQSATRVDQIAVRIDQIYPTLLKQQEDIGAIRISLQASAQNFAILAEQLKPLAGFVEQQHKQAKGIDDLTVAVGKLTGALSTMQGQLDAIETRVKSLPVQKGDLLRDPLITDSDPITQKVAQGIRDPICKGVLQTDKTEVPFILCFSAADLSKVMSAVYKDVTNPK